MERLKDYFFLCGKNSSVMTSAFSPKKAKIGAENIADLVGRDTMPFDLMLVKLTKGKTGLIENYDISSVPKELIWLDYQVNDLAWPIFSEKLKNIFQEHISDKDMIDWVSVKIKGNGETKTYYILRFNEKKDVIDKESSKYMPNGNLVIPVYSFDKIKDLCVFTEPRNFDFWKITIAVYVNETLKKAIQKAKCIGVSFEKIRVSYE